MSKIISTIAECIVTRGYFDRDWYNKSYGVQISSNQSLETHFVEVGSKTGLQPRRGLMPENALLHFYENPNAKITKATLRIPPSRLLRGVLGRELIKKYPRRTRSYLSRLTSSRRTTDLNALDKCFDYILDGYDIRLSHLKINEFLDLMDQEGSRFVRFPHGHWDHYGYIERLYSYLSNNANYPSTSCQRQWNMSTYLAQVAWPSLYPWGDFSNNFMWEVDEALKKTAGNRKFMFSLSFGGPRQDGSIIPAPDSLTQPQKNFLDRFSLSPNSILDATLWKRYALLGQLDNFVRFVASKDVVAVGPPHLRCLEDVFHSNKFRHIVTPRRDGPMVRSALLDAVVCETRDIEDNKETLFIFQCGSSLAFWLIAHLDLEFPRSIMMDVGQGLDALVGNSVRHAPGSWARISGRYNSVH